MVPRVWDSIRAGLDGRSGRALGGIAAAVVVAAVIGVWLGRPTATPVPPLPAVAAAGSTTEAGSATSSGTTAPAASGQPVDDAAAATSRAAEDTPTAMVVSVVGLVHRPGVVTLTPGARVADALVAVGGPLANADTLTLNLARPLSDGEQIVVGMLLPESPPPASEVIGGGSSPVGTIGADPAGAAGSDTASPGGPLSLSSATAADLEGLPGIGPVTAAAIIQWRDDNGPFTSVEQLMEVSGIGPARFDRLRSQVVP